MMSNFDKSVDPTVGAGMNIDELMNKLMSENAIENSQQNSNISDKNTK